MSSGGHYEYGIRLPHGTVMDGPYPSDPYLSAQDAFNDRGLAEGEEMVRRLVGDWEVVK